MRSEVSRPELAGPFRNEQQFKDAWIYFLRSTGSFTDVFEVENEEKAPGFPDVLCVTQDGRAVMYEMKIADKGGSFKMERTQPRFYVAHPRLTVCVVVWCAGRTWCVPAADIARKALASAGTRMNINDFPEEAEHGPEVPDSQH